MVLFIRNYLTISLSVYFFFLQMSTITIWQREYSHSQDGFSQSSTDFFWEEKNSEMEFIIKIVTKDKYKIIF